MYKLIIMFIKYNYNYIISEHENKLINKIFNSYKIIKSNYLKHCQHLFCNFMFEI